MAFWIPYLTSEPTNDNKLKVKRTNYFDELKECLKILCQPNDNILVWHLFESLGSVELRKMKEELMESIETGPLRLSLIVCDNLRNIPKDMFRNFNKVFILGYSANQTNLPAVLGNLLCPDGLAVVIPAENPLSFLPIRKPEIISGFKTPEIHIPELNGVKEHYLLSALASSPSSHISQDIIEKIWGKEFSQKIIKDLEKNGLLHTENGKVVIMDKDAIFESAGELRWGVLEKKWFIFYLQEQSGESRKFYFGKYLFPSLIYPDAVYYYGSDKYLIPTDIKETASELRLIYASENSPVLTIPLIKYSFKNKSKTPDIIKKLKGFGQLLFYGDAEIEIEFNGYKSYRSLEYKCEPGEEIGEEIKLKRKTPLIKFHPDNPEGILQILRIFLPAYFKDMHFTFDIFSDDQSIYIASIIPKNLRFKELYPQLLSIIPQIYDYGYHLLLSCPCLNGCPLCLKSIKSPEEVGPIKSQTLITLAEALKKKDEAEFNIRFKSKGLEVSESQKKYKEWRNKIVKDIFVNKFEMEIKEPARLVVEELKDCSGKFFPGENVVKVNPNLPEALAVEIIAHEYAHNWEFEEGNMCAELMNEKYTSKGNLIVEGFAEWVAFKVLDFYGLADYMELIDLNEYNEYGDGFDLLKWIEDNVAGFYGVIEFVKTGKVLDPEANIEYNLEKLLKESGIWDKIK